MQMQQRSEEAVITIELAMFENIMTSSNFMVSGQKIFSLCEGSPLDLQCGDHGFT